MKKYILPVDVDLIALAQQLQTYDKNASLEKIHDRLVYMVGTIFKQCIYKLKDDEELISEELWVTLQAELLKKVIGGNYVKYRDVLMKHNIIKFNGSYIPNKESMKYSIHDSFIYEACRTVEITDKCVLSKIEEVYKELQKTNRVNLKKVKHLTKVLDTGKLTIDKIAAEKWIKQEDKKYRLAYQNIQQLISVDKNKKKVKMHPDLRNTRHENLLEDFIQQKYNYSVDIFGNRFHSLLTYSPSGFRSFLKYDGEQLVSLDLKNSQPYLLNGILHDNFITREGKFSLKGLHPDMYKNLQKLKKEKKLNFEASVIPVEYKSQLELSLRSKHMKPLSIMLQSIAQTHAVKGVQFLNFSSLCQQGLYEFIQQEFVGHFFTNDEDIFSNRDKSKLEVMHMFYCNPSNRKSRKDMKPFNKFLKLFPAEGNLLLMLKSGEHKDDYKNAPMLLQRMESYLFLDVIANKLTKKNIPVLTIHDSITVRERDKTVAKQIMEDVLYKHIGLIPTIKEEIWEIEEH